MKKRLIVAADVSRRYVGRALAFGGLVLAGAATASATPGPVVDYDPEATIRALGTDVSRLITLVMGAAIVVMAAYFAFRLVKSQLLRSS